MLPVYIFAICWLAFRTLMQKTNPKYTNYDLDYFHHSDAGIVGVFLSMLFNSIPWLIFNIIVVIDDIIGHWLAGHGKPEQGPLEILIWPLYKIYYRIAKCKNR